MHILTNYPAILHKDDCANQWQGIVLVIMRLSGDTREAASAGGVVLILEISDTAVIVVKIADKNIGGIITGVLLCRGH